MPAARAAERADGGAAEPAGDVRLELPSGRPGGLLEERARLGAADFAAAASVFAGGRAAPHVGLARGSEGRWRELHVVREDAVLRVLDVAAMTYPFISLASLQQLLGDLLFWTQQLQPSRGRQVSESLSLSSGGAAACARAGAAKRLADCSSRARFSLQPARFRLSLPAI